MSGDGVGDDVGGMDVGEDVEETDVGEDVGEIVPSLIPRYDELRSETDYVVDDADVVVAVVLCRMSVAVVSRRYWRKTFRREFYRRAV